MDIQNSLESLQNEELFEIFFLSKLAKKLTLSDIETIQLANIFENSIKKLPDLN
tara:strand:- start:109 stop:270 length:162 start_codon:yes stop_codon:yes gene_type:complete